MNRDGVIAQRHWARWLPRQYAAISDPDSFFTTLGEEVARQIDDLTDELVGEIQQSDSYLAHVGRLFAARAMAEELILPQRVLPDAELAADDQDDMPPESGERPMVVDRDHRNGGSRCQTARTDRQYRRPGADMNAVADSWAFWIGLIGALAVLCVLPTLIGVLRHVESLALVVILNLFPIA